MKTHLHNTVAKNLDNDIVGHNQFLKHQEALHSKIKPVVSTRRKQQYKVHNNNKVALMHDPQKIVKSMFHTLHDKSNFKSTIDNKNSYYQKDKKILKDKIKKNKHQNYMKSEHERQLRHMHSRIANCKNMEMRKKDKTDPITNPAYFMRPSDKATSVGLASYKQKVLSMNKNRSYLQGKGPSSTNSAFQLRMSQPKLPPDQLKDHGQSYGSIPNYSTLNKGRPLSAAKPSQKKADQRPKTANGKNIFESGLPGCTFRQILNHIVDNKMYKETDLKVLYVRLCHKYEQPNVQEIWQSLMDELER